MNIADITKTYTDDDIEYWKNHLLYCIVDEFSSDEETSKNVIRDSISFTVENANVTTPFLYWILNSMDTVYDTTKIFRRENGCKQIGVKDYETEYWPFLLRLCNEVSDEYFSKSVNELVVL